jgi:hypothetical protein
VGEVLDILQKCSSIEEWGNACEFWLGCGLGDVVCTAGHSIQVVLGLAGENYLTLGLAGRTRCCERSLLVLWGEAPEVSEKLGWLLVVHLLSGRSWRMHCSLEWDSRLTSLVLSVEQGSLCRGGRKMSSTPMAYQWCICEIMWQNLVFSLLMPAKANCASSLAKHMAGHSAQNGGSRTAMLNT